MNSEVYVKSKLRATLEDSCTKSKYSPNFWTGVLWVTSTSEHIIFLLKAPLIIWPSFDSLHKFQIITLKGFLVQLHRNTFDSWCLEQLIERCLWLFSTKRVPASVVLWSLSLQLLQASSWASRFLYSAAGTNDFKRFTEVPHPGITTKNMKWSGERKGDGKDWA